MGTRWPLHTALEVVGGKWKLVLVMRIVDGITTFNDLQRSLPGVSHKQLAQCLRALERDGLIAREVLHARPLAVRYAITPLGASLQGVADALYAWGDDWLRAHGR
jgi:DNA-binding HxlR family transcriptional regulator